MEQSPRFHSMPQPIECHSCNFDKDLNSKKTKALLTNILKKIILSHVTNVSLVDVITKIIIMCHYNR